MREKQRPTETEGQRCTPVSWFIHQKAIIPGAGLSPSRVWQEPNHFRGSVLAGNCWSETHLGMVLPDTPLGDEGI